MPRLYVLFEFRVDSTLSLHTHARAACGLHSSAFVSKPDVDAYAAFPLLFQITQLKIDHNPFAKGFRDNYDSYVPFGLLRLSTIMTLHFCFVFLFFCFF